MKKKTSFSTKGQRADIDLLRIHRILPNRYADKVGPFVFLDHIAPVSQNKINTSGTGAHPHRGIATLTYVISGEVEHFDSRGNHRKVHSGGIQWMKAGNGIIHDEILNADSQTGKNTIHAFQFWINLPTRIKEEDPEYRAIQGNDVPQLVITPEGSLLKVIVGEYQGLRSAIPNYSEQFLYHLQIKSGDKINLQFDLNTEVAAFLPTSDAVLNDAHFKKGEFIEFDRMAGEIEMEGIAGEPAEIILFGGAPYTDPMVAEGPFVMNDLSGITEAYKDFYAGKYGRIEHKQNE